MTDPDTADARARRAAAAFRSKETLYTMLDALLMQLREQKEPTINTVIALTELLDKWMMLLAVDVATSTSAPDWHERVVDTLTAFLETLTARRDEIASRKSEIAKRGKVSWN